MQERYSPPVLARQVAKELHRIERLLQQRQEKKQQ
jgi:hypothetical protein